MTLESKSARTSLARDLEGAGDLPVAGQDLIPFSPKDRVLFPAVELYEPQAVEGRPAVGLRFPDRLRMPRVGKINKAHGVWGKSHCYYRDETRESRFDGFAQQAARQINRAGSDPESRLNGGNGSVADSLTNANPPREVLSVLFSEENIIDGNSVGQKRNNLAIAVRAMSLGNVAQKGEPLDWMTRDYVRILQLVSGSVGTREARKLLPRWSDLDNSGSLKAAQTAFNLGMELVNKHVFTPDGLKQIVLNSADNGGPADLMMAWGILFRSLNEMPSAKYGAKAMLEDELPQALGEFLIRLKSSGDCDQFLAHLNELTEAAFLTYAKGVLTEEEGAGWYANLLRDLISERSLSLEAITFRLLDKEEFFQKLCNIAGEAKTSWLQWLGQKKSLRESQELQSLDGELGEENEMYRENVKGIRAEEREVRDNYLAQVRQLKEQIMATATGIAPTHKEIARALFELIQQQLAVTSASSSHVSSLRTMFMDASNADYVAGAAVPQALVSPEKLDEIFHKFVDPHKLMEKMAELEETMISVMKEGFEDGEEKIKAEFVEERERFRELKRSIENQMSELERQGAEILFPMARVAETARRKFLSRVLAEMATTADLENAQNEAETVVLNFLKEPFLQNLMKIMALSEVLDWKNEEELLRRMKQGEMAEGQSKEGKNKVDKSESDNVVDVGAASE